MIGRCDRLTAPAATRHPDQPDRRSTRSARLASHALTILLGAALTTALTACGGADKPNGPGPNPQTGSVPPELVGSWNLVGVSETGWTDPVSGVYTPATQISITRTFQTDGQYEEVTYEKEMVAGCWTSIFDDFKGVATARDTLLTLNKSNNTEIGDGNCGVTPYQGKRLPSQTEVVAWKIDNTTDPRALWLKPAGHTDYDIGPYLFKKSP